VRIAAIVLLLLLSGCTGHGASQGYGLEQPQSAMVTEPDAGIALPWPPPAAHSASASGSLGLSDISASSSGCTIEADSISIAAGSEAFGWAIFSRGGYSAAQAPARVTLVTALQSEAAGQGSFWFAAANYRTGRWDWLAQFGPQGPAEFFLPACDAYVSSTGAIALALVVADHSSELALNGLDLLLLDTTGGPAFPRLGMWYPDFERNSVAECADYDLLIGDFNIYLHWNEAEGRYSTALRAANPKVRLLQYACFSEMDYASDAGVNPWLKDWEPGWLLSEAGTLTNAPVDAAMTEISVADWMQSGPAQPGNPASWEIFHEDGDLQCGAEIMTVTGLDEAGQILSVLRGQRGSLAAAHPAGTRIAPLIRYWPGTYVMNLSSACPTAQLHGAASAESFAEYALRMSAAGQLWFDDLSGDFDGLLLDRMEDEQAWLAYENCSSFDLNRDNVPDSFGSFDSAWLAGIENITVKLRARFPGKAIVRNNGGGQRYADYNGSNFESFPRAEWNEAGSSFIEEWHYACFGAPEENYGGLSDWALNSPAPNYSWLETYEDDSAPDPDGDGSYVNPFDQPGFAANTVKMRLGLASALLAGSYFSYEINTNGHGALGLLRFPEYDDSGRGRGYLGWPLDPGDLIQFWNDPDNTEQGVWGCLYSGGLVLVNPDSAPHQVTLPGDRWRRAGSSEYIGSQTTLPAQSGLILLRVQR
jgi:hypothetical protein